MKPELEIIKILSEQLELTMDKIGELVMETDITKRNQIALDAGTEIVKAVNQAKEIMK